ncbi:MAG TPA: AI-2E family transporter YdiK [Bdellovibrio sp.]|nr:AI-2E family transporter YdiK [Bdellovibrio sp.]
MEKYQTGLARTLLASLFIGLMVGGCLWVLKPFLPALVWATMIVVATWPLYKKMQKKMNSSKLALTFMLLAMAVIVFIPLAMTAYVLVSHTDEAIIWLKKLPEFTLPPPPDWLAKIPLAGDRLIREWSHLSQAGPGSLAAFLQPYMRDAFAWLTQAVKSTGALFVHLLLTLALCGILYAGGETATHWVILFARRIAGDRGESSVILAGQSIKAVALGIVVTAVVQSILGGFGLWIAGVPFAGIITAVMFICCIAQLGPILPLLVGVAWLYRQDYNTVATILLVWTLAVGLLDNFLRPILIHRGADLPLLLILAGVLGGLFAFGIVGLFIGPVILAVTYRLLEAWITEELPPSVEPTPKEPSPAPREDMPQNFLT